jgi:hypothetical protein
MFKKDNEMRRRTLEDLVIWESVTEETDALLPNAAVTAALGHLFIASHYDFLEKILTDTRSTKALASSNQYRTVQRTLDGFGMPVHAVQIFSLTDRQGRATYELLRQGKMPQSETMLGRVLNVLLGAHKGVSRKQELDARKMPDFDLVRRCLGPAGMQVVSEPDGWFLKGFMLSQ